MKNLTLIVILLLCSGTGWTAWINDPAPEFSLENLKKETETLASKKGKILLINFWASWCPPCKEEFPELLRLASEQEADVEVIAINVDKTRSNLDRFLKRQTGEASAVRVLWDPKGKTASAYGVRAMPSSFVVDRNGVIRYGHLGYHETDKEKWRQELTVLLKEKLQ